MSLELIFDLAWKSVLFAGATLLMLRLFRRRSAAERSWIASMGLVSLMLLPLTLLVGPEWHLQPPKQVAAVMPSLEPSAMLPPPSAPVQATSPAAPNTESWVVSAEGLVWTYVVITGLLILGFLMSVLRLYLLRGRAEVLVDAQWSTALSAAQRRMKFKHGTALLVSEELRSPISWGVVRPVILLDQKAASDASQAEAIIAHELAHVARLDWAMLIVGRLATSLYWFNPLVWMLARWTQELSEQAADDSVLNSDIPRTEYARLLINTACHDNRTSILAANGVAGCGSLSQRVERVLDTSVSRRAARGGWVLGCFTALFCVAGPVAALSSRSQPPVQAAADDQRRPAFAPAAARSPALEQALLSAVDMGDVEAMNQLIAHGVSVNASVDGDGSPLIVAVRQGRRDLVEALLAKGADIDMAVEGDGNPLIAAAAAGNLALVQHLLDRGASVNASVDGDGSPLIVAARLGRRDVAEALLAGGADIDMGVEGDGNPLIAAAAAGNLALVQYLLDRGANIEAVVAGDENALMQAAYHGHEAVVRLLIARGANVNSRVGHRTPLVMAAKGRHAKIAALLREAGATQ